MKPPLLTIRAIRSIGVEVPMTYALGTARGVTPKAPLLLIDLETEEGVTGRSYLWCYFPAAVPAIANILEEVARGVKGGALAPVSPPLWCSAPAALRALARTVEGGGGVVRGAPWAPADLWSKLAERF